MLYTGYVPYSDHSAYFFDNYNLTNFSAPMAVFYGGWIGFKAINKIMSTYIVKMQYSKDRELVFVTAIDNYGVVSTKAYETEHLEILPPGAVTLFAKSTMADKDGIYTVNDLNTGETFAMFKDSK
jgi:hypothetical protein